ncbi:MAG: maltose alpha-D-glucosyltransferase [Synechococcales bacterium]|nr:maltose alpha-D-glucosyltransferase [Synechococcales bacterium]
MTEANQALLNNSPLWFKEAIIYEVPVRAFADSNADGIGDFAGLTERLDYLKDLGITAVWLLPFFPSPLKDDGYDIADYTNVNLIYGTLEDFKDFLKAAHQRGIRVIIELIVNHTSDQHPWFQRARRSPKGSVERDFYVWSDTPQKYQDARIIFQDFESSNWAWDPVAQAYYWHRFYSHQPDLNYDNPAVRDAVFSVLDFWLSMGVDGLRMDAVPYLYEREGTNCENLPETHEFLKSLRQYVDERYPNRMLLAEANQWPEDAAAYYGDGDECHMNFHFPLMPRLFMALRMEDNFPIIDILQQTPPIPDNCQWGLFLRNHDELTLEMVTDEDRDYMYRTYAQDPQMRLNLGIRRRLAPLLGNDRRQIELLNSLLLSLPGTPVLYYGDEIGMGDNVYLGDRNGVRTPMQWSPDRNAGFSRATPHKLYLPLLVESEYHYEAINVEAQRTNPNSLWYTLKRLITMRKRLPALGKGGFELLHPDNRKVFAFTRTYEGEHVLVLANLSRFVQTVEIDLSDFQGMIPVEIFGRTEFPLIQDEPYFLSLGAYACYWFALKPQPSQIQAPHPADQIPTLTLAQPWQDVFVKRELEAPLEAALLDYLYTYYWFEGRVRKVQSAHVVEAIPVTHRDADARMVWLRVDFIDGEPQTYLLLIGHAEGEQAMHLLTEMPQVVVARLHTHHPDQTDQVEVLFDAIASGSNRNATAGRPIFTALLEAIAHNRVTQGFAGELMATATEQFPDLDRDLATLHPAPLREEQRNSSIIYDEHLILKLFRRQEEGINPDLEIRRFLGEQGYQRHIAPLVGALEYHRPDRGVMTVGIMQTYVTDVRNSWDYTLDGLRDYFERVITQHDDVTDVPVPSQPLVALQAMDVSAFAIETIGAYLTSVEDLGRSTADLHLAIASDPHNPGFAPEPFSSFYQRSIYQSARNLTGQTLRTLKQRLPSLPEAVQPLARKVLNHQDALINHFQSLIHQKITALRIRCHGDYHLRQVLYTGKDFVLVDFEGDPARTLSERRLKRSALRDVAEMLQSFAYAAEIALHQEVESGMLGSEQIPLMRQWTQFWQRWVSATFLKSYLAAAGQGTFLPKTEQELGVLLNAYLLERNIYSLRYELDCRPERVAIALQQMLQLLERPEFGADEERYER